jgi:hypothetical protein
MPKGKKGKKGGKKGASKKKSGAIEGFPGLEVFGAEKPDGLLLALL